MKGECIERVRRQKRLAGQNRTEQAKFDAYARFAARERASLGTVVMVTPPPAPRKWRQFWRSA